MNPDLQKIKEASDGLLFLSESDYPFELVYLENSSIQLDKELLKLTDRSLGTKIEKTTLEYFFRNMTRIYQESTEEEKKIANRFILLQNTLNSDLTEIEVYRFGDIQIDAIIIGKLKNGKYGGLKTKLIET